jgi:hypothetical protein
MRLSGLENPLDAVDPLLRALGDLPQFGEHELLAAKLVEGNAFSFRTSISATQEQLQTSRSSPIG